MRFGGRRQETGKEWVWRKVTGKWMRLDLLHTPPYHRPTHNVPYHRPPHTPDPHANTADTPPPHTKIQHATSANLLPSPSLFMPHPPLESIPCSPPPSFHAAPSAVTDSTFFDGTGQQSKKGCKGEEECMEVIFFQQCLEVEWVADNNKVQKKVNLCNTLLK